MKAFLPMDLSKVRMGQAEGSGGRRLSLAHCVYANASIGFACCSRMEGWQRSAGLS